MSELYRNEEGGARGLNQRFLSLTVSLKTRYCESFFDWFRRGDEFK